MKKRGMMNIIDALKSKLKRFFSNGLTEVKEFYSNGQIRYHYFEDEYGEYHGEYKRWYDNGTLCEHCYFEHDELVKDYLEGK